MSEADRQLDLELAAFVPHQPQPVDGEVAPVIDAASELAAVEELDGWTVHLLNERLDLALRADAEKDRLGRPSLAPLREQQVLDLVMGHSRDFGDQLDHIALITAYTNLMRSTRTRQLQARAVRRTISADETRILEKVTGRSSGVEPAPRDEVPLLTEEELDASEALLGQCRSGIDAVDRELVSIWAERQQRLLRVGQPQLVGPMLNRLHEINQASRPEGSDSEVSFDTVDLISVLEGVFASMKAAQLEQARQSRARLRSGMGDLSTRAADITKPE